MYLFVVVKFFFKKMHKNNNIIFLKKIKNTNVQAHFVIVILSKEFNEASHFYYYF